MGGWTVIGTNAAIIAFNIQIDHAAVTSLFGSTNFSVGSTGVVAGQRLGGGGGYAGDAGEGHHYVSVTISDSLAGTTPSTITVQCSATGDI
jgi:hypothetical protein